MTKHDPPFSDHHDPGFSLTQSLPVALLDTPLEYIFADHKRQRGVCAALLSLAMGGEASQAETDCIAMFLTHDRLLHHADEDEDLFPILRRRALPQDDLAGLLISLTDEHRHSNLVARQIVSALETRAANAPGFDREGDNDVIRSYAAAEQRHIAIENAVVMALAQIRLTRGDLRSLSCSMKARRGMAG